MIGPRKNAFYAIVDYRTLEVVTTTKHESYAAFRLEPGTVFGIGDMEAEAIGEAKERARAWRKARWV